MTLRKGGIGNVLALMAIVGIIVAALVLMLNTLTQQQRIGQITTQSVQRQVTTFELRQRLSACSVTGTYGKEKAMGIKVNDITTFCKYTQGVQLTFEVNGKVYTAFVPFNTIKNEGSIKVGNYDLSVVYSACNEGMQPTSIVTNYSKFEYQIPAAVVFEVKENNKPVTAFLQSAQILVKNIGWIPAPNCFQQTVLPVGFTASAGTNITYITNIYTLNEITLEQLKEQYCSDGRLYLLVPVFNGTRNNVPISVAVYDNKEETPRSVNFYLLLKLPSQESDVYYLENELPWSITIPYSNLYVYTTLLESPIPLKTGSGLDVVIAMCIHSKPISLNKLMKVNVPTYIDCYTPKEKALQLHMCYAAPKNSYLAIQEENKAIQYLQYPVDSVRKVATEVIYLSPINPPTSTTPPNKYTVEVKICNYDNENIIINPHEELKITLNSNKSAEIQAGNTVVANNIELNNCNNNDLEVKLVNDGNAKVVDFNITIIDNANMFNKLKNIKILDDFDGKYMGTIEINTTSNINSDTEIDILNDAKAFKGTIIIGGINGNVGDINGNIKILSGGNAYVMEGSTITLQAHNINSNANIDILEKAVICGHYCGWNSKNEQTKIEINAKAIDWQALSILKDATICKKANLEIDVKATTLNGNYTNAILNGATACKNASVNIYINGQSKSLKITTQTECKCAKQCMNKYKSYKSLSVNQTELKTQQSQSTQPGGPNVEILSGPTDGVLVYISNETYVDPYALGCCTWHTAKVAYPVQLIKEIALYPGDYGLLVDRVDLADTKYSEGALSDHVIVAPLWTTKKLAMEWTDTNMIKYVYFGPWRVYKVQYVLPEEQNEEMMDVLTAVNRYGDIIMTYTNAKLLKKIADYYIGLHYVKGETPTIVKVKINGNMIDTTKDTNNLSIIIVNKHNFYVNVYQVELEQSRNNNQKH